jgi:hypothetical protein
LFTETTDRETKLMFEHVLPLAAAQVLRRQVLRNTFPA